MRWRRRLGAVVGAAAVMLGVVACSDEPKASAPPVVAVPLDTVPDVSYTIPAGASAAVARGDATQILPSPLVLKVGQVIKIVNQDRLGYDIGPFYVGAGETIVQKANAVGTFSTVCTLHPTGRIEVRMVAA